MGYGGARTNHQCGGSGEGLQNLRRWQYSYDLQEMYQSELISSWSFSHPRFSSLGQNSQASGLKESGAKELDAADAKADQIHRKNTKSHYSLSGP